VDATVYPIGRFERPDPITPAAVAGAIAELAALPAALRGVMAGVRDPDLAIRPGAWTARQVVHHLADSHMNAVMRVRVALCGPDADVVAFDRLVTAGLYGCLAELPDARGAPVEDALVVLAAVHRRWVQLLRGLDDARLMRTWVTPGYAGERSIARLTLVYAWHGRHHTAQIARMPGHPAG